MGFLFKTLLFLYTGFIAYASFASETILVKEGKIQCVIITSTSPSGCVKYATKELADNLMRITGNKPEIKRASTNSKIPLVKFAEGKQAILIGESVYTKNLNISPEKLAGDGFVIKTFPGGIAIVGSDDHENPKRFRLVYNRYPAAVGTLYGVYFFLEQLGFRWFYPNPKFDVIPDKKTIMLPELNVRKEPFFEYRFAYGYSPWRRKVGYGGVVDPWSTRHTFEKTVNVKKKYPHLKGFHFQHPGVIDAIKIEAENLLKKRTPVGRKFFLVIPPDAYLDGCKCAICKKYKTPERGAKGLLSDYVGKAVVETANHVKDLVPEGKIVYCAYERYRLPPLKIKKLPENVVVLFTVPRAPFYDAQKKQEAWNEIMQWSKLKPSKAYFCRYSQNFLKLTPSFVPNLLAEDIRRMKKAKESGKLNICGEMSFGSLRPDKPYSWWFHLNEYFTAKLLWDPTLSVDTLLKDYCSQFFGPGATPMESFFKRLEELYFNPKERFLYSNTTIKELDVLLNAARKLTKGTKYEKNFDYINQGFDLVRKIKSQRKSSNKTNHPKNDLILYLSFEHNKGGKTKDASGKQHSTINVKETVGILGKALHFDGKSSAIVLKKGISLRGDYSFSLWIKPSNTSFKKTQNLLGPNCWKRHYLGIVHGVIAMKHRRPGKNSSRNRSFLKAKSSEIKPGKWTHIAATFSKENGMAIYINGVLTALDPSMNLPSQYGIRIIGAGGRKSPSHLSYFFGGDIDELKIYKRELSIGEINKYYQQIINKRKSK